MTYRLNEHVPLAPLTTFKIGGPARWLVDVSTVDDIRRALLFARTNGVPYTVLAGGSNMLIADAGIPHVVMHMVGEQFRFAAPYLYAEAGAPLSMLIEESAKLGLSGWESLAGIPGSVGGAIRGNAGAFDTEIANVVEAVRAYHTRTDQVYDFEKEACDFIYRDSIFKHEPEWIITHVVIKLHEGDKGEIQRAIAKTIREREKRHIQRIRAAGSFFMNPQAPPAVRALYEYEKKTICKGRRVPAGWLIEKVGGKGLSVGGATASEQHPNYLVNTSGDALGRDVYSLAVQLQKAVYDRYKIELVPEVTCSGF